MKRRTRITALALGAGLTVVGVVHAGGGPQPVLVIETSGLHSILVDAKDQPLARALAMFPARVRELPGEIPDMPPQAAGIATLALDSIARPMRLAVVSNPENPARGAFGYGAVVSLHVPSQERAAQLHGLLNTGLQQNPNLRPMLKPSQQWEGMNDIQTPFAIVTYGPRQSGGAWRYEVIAGSIDDPEQPFSAWSPAPGGVTPVARVRLDLSALAPAVQMAKNLAGAQNPQAAAQLAQLEDSVLLGEGAPRLEVQAGYTETEMVTHSVITNARAIVGSMGLPTQPVTAAELAVIPSDAFSAGISRLDFAFVGRLIDQAAEAGAPVRGALEQFKIQTGVDLRADILDAVGGTVVHYSSDATGGGSLLSGVALVSFKDRERFAAANARLVGFANAMTQQIPKGTYVRVATWEHAGQELVSLRFPGLPVPLELSWALTEKWLVMGLSPQAVVAAARQASGQGDKGLGANPAFAAAMPKGKEVVSLKFLDSGRAMRAGYPMVMMLGTAVANAVRSPLDPGRDPGMIVPPFNDLAKGARPSVEYAYWSGDNLVSEGHADRSMLVNLSAAAGSVMRWAPLAAIPALGAAAKQGKLGWDDAGAYAPAIAALDWLPLPDGAELLLLESVVRADMAGR